MHWKNTERTLDVIPRMNMASANWSSSYIQHAPSQGEKQVHGQRSATMVKMRNGYRVYDFRYLPLKPSLHGDVCHKRQMASITNPKINGLIMLGGKMRKFVCVLYVRAFSFILRKDLDSNHFSHSLGFICTCQTPKNHLGFKYFKQGFQWN